MASRRDPNALVRVLEKIGRYRARRRHEQPDPHALSPWEFRALADERLRNLERQIDELKLRVNGLLFALAGVVATQVVLRLLE